MCVALALGAMLLYRMSLAVVDVDLWHAMALARETLACGYVPQTDSFAYTPTVTPVVHHEWGAGMIAYLAALGGGAAGLLLLRYALAAGLGWACWRCWRGRGATFATVRFLAPLAILMVDVGLATIRAQQYSFLFAALLLVWLDQDRQGGRRWIWLALPLFLLWANVHAGVAFGLLFLAAHTLEQAWRRRPVGHLVATGAAAVALLAVNPWGLAYYGYLLRATTMPRPMVTEWMPLLQSADPLRIGLFAVSAALAGWTVWRVGPRRFEGWLLLALMLLAALKSYRLLCFYAIVWICYVPGYLEEALKQTRLRGQVLDTFTARDRGQFVVWSGIAVLFVVLALGHHPWRAQVPGHTTPGRACWPTYPVGAVDYLRQAGFEGNALTRFEYGAYVSWKLYPRVKVSFDSRYEVAYPPGALQRNVAVYDAQPGWEQYLEQSQTDVAVVRKDSPLAAKLGASPQWRQVYTDDVFAVYARPGLPLASQMLAVAPEGVVP